MGESSRFTNISSSHTSPHLLLSCLQSPPTPTPTLLRSTRPPTRAERGKEPPGAAAPNCALAPPARGCKELADLRGRRPSGRKRAPGPTLSALLAKRAAPPSPRVAGRQAGRRGLLARRPRLPEKFPSRAPPSLPQPRGAPDLGGSLSPLGRRRRASSTPRSRSWAAEALGPPPPGFPFALGSPSSALAGVGECGAGGGVEAGGAGRPTRPVEFATWFSPGENGTVRRLLAALRPIRGGAP